VDLQQMSSTDANFAEALVDRQGRGGFAGSIGRKPGRGRGRGIKK
jgi:hypothetical protein